MVPFLEEILLAFPGSDTRKARRNIAVSGIGSLPSWFEVTDLATASFASAGVLLAQFVKTGAASSALTLEPDSSANPCIVVDQRLASMWFGMTLRPKGWQIPPAWDPIAGDYRTQDGWIRLHTNAPLHRAAALAVLGDYGTRATLESQVAKWEADALEAAVIEAGGCAATMRDLTSWSQHPQGRAVSKEPLIHWTLHEGSTVKSRPIFPQRPLAGIKVLDLTRVLAGPVAGRFLAAYGAEVLRIDPPEWDEPGIIPEVTLGKRCAGLDLTHAPDRHTFKKLLAQADVLLHGYRPEALENLGYGRNTRCELNPNLIDVSLNAYGWTGPWANRRGFDSLVQMSSGIAAYGLTQSGADKPIPLPVQALDHAAGYLLAGAVLHALGEIRRSGKVLSARLSLARVARLLSQSKRDTLSAGISPETSDDLAPEIEETAWGPAQRLRFPLSIEGISATWDFPASGLRSSAPVWLEKQNKF